MDVWRTQHLEGNPMVRRTWSSLERIGYVRRKGESQEGGLRNQMLDSRNPVSWRTGKPHMDFGNINLPQSGVKVVLITLQAQKYGINNTYAPTSSAEIQV